MQSFTSAESPATDPVARALSLRTTLVSDSLDRHRLPGTLVGLRMLSGTRFAGRAFTVGYADRIDDGPSEVGDFLDDAPPGSAIVIANRGRTDCSIWGALTTLAARRDGIAGTVIDGACRDLAELSATGYPLCARGVVPRTGKDRVTLSSVGADVEIAGVLVAPGDLVLADQDGVVAIPAARVDEVLDTAELIREREDGIAAELARGSSLAAARARYGYMSLQRPDQSG